MHTIDKKLKAIDLRKEGYAFSHISREINVAKSTLSLWLTDVPFIPNELTKYSMIKGQKYNAEVKRADKAFSLKQAEKYAIDRVGQLSETELFFLGIGIYIGEGSKTGNLTRIVNADPRIVRFAIKWFQTCLSVQKSQFRVRIHMYPDTNPEEAVQFWSKELSLDRSCFYEPHIDARNDKKAKKKKILPYGTAHLTVIGNGNKDHGVLLHRKIIASIDRVLEGSARD